MTSPLERSIVAKDVVDTLRRGILRGKYRRGEYLTEVGICRALNVSRGTARRAFQQLREDGLVTSDENSHTIVQGLTAKDIDDIYELRLLLEKRAAHILLRADYTDYMPILESMSRLQRAYVRGGGENPLEMAALGYEVHVSVMGATRNKALFNAWKSLASTLQIIMEINGNTVDCRRAFESHKQLVDAILQKRDDIEGIIEEHLIRDSKDIYLRELDRTAQGPSAKGRNADD